MTAGEPRLRRGLGVLPLAAVVFFNVSGGPYGIEDTVPAFGPGLTLLLLVVTPLVWSLPVALAMSEMAAAMPDEGGYVTWVRRAFGPFWSFQVGWWSWIDSFVDVAVYPALFVEYLRFWWPDVDGAAAWALKLTFIVVLTALNVAGVRPVGVGAVVLGAVTLAPVAVLVAAGAGGVARAPWLPFTTGGDHLVTSVGLGLAVVMWNYSGWDTPSTCLGETRQPARAFVRAQLAMVPVVACVTALPVAIGLASGTADWQRWGTGTLPAVAASVGGPWLGHLVAAGAVVSAAGLFLALLLTNSRLPYVLARDGMFPRGLAALASTGTPARAVVLSAVAYAGCAAFSFKELIVLNVWLYSLALIVELAAFLRLRALPFAPAGAWRVPGGWSGAILVAALPCALSLLAMATAGFANTVAGAVAASTGPLGWLCVRRYGAAQVSGPSAIGGAGAATGALAARPDRE